jgi:hypothetical protein
MRYCIRCNLGKDESEFGFDIKAKDYINNTCISCVENQTLNKVVKRRVYVSAYDKRNPDKVVSRIAKRRATKIKANVSWANEDRIKQIYKECKALGIGYHVDHIVPLTSPLVCGFHCEANLQILPAQDNFKKSNRVWPDMP